MAKILKSGWSKVPGVTWDTGCQAFRAKCPECGKRAWLRRTEEEDIVASCTACECEFTVDDKQG